jgi:aspartate/methionine/tyrosine aminotransferase
MPEVASFRPFLLEEWQSRYEQTVRYNLADSGVQPVTIRELLSEEQIERLLDLPIHYPEVNGTLALRRQIAARYPGATPAHVLVTVGAAEANQIICQTLLAPGSEVVVMEPGYRQVWGLAHNIGCTVRSFGLDPERGWRPDLASFDRAISANTRLVALVNPNNPTGAILTEAEMQHIAQAARRVGAWLLADEVYIGSERIDDQETPSFWGMGARTLIVGSMSKAYGLSGLRLGWVVAEPDLIEELWRRHEYATIATSAPAMLLAEAALAPDARARLIERQRALIQRGWSQIEAWAARYPDLVSVVPPQATALSFVRYHVRLPSVEVAEAIRQEGDVLVAPGACFGVEQHLRITHGLEAGYVAEALERIAGVLSELRAREGSDER